MYTCKNTEEGCGMNGVDDFRCCFYCGFKNTCNGFCINLEADGNDTEEIARACNFFVDNED